MTSVIGHEDNGWTSATMDNGKLIEQHRDQVQDIHQHATSQRLTPASKSVTQQYAESMLSHEVMACEGGICMSAGKIYTTCDKHSPCKTYGLSSELTPEMVKQLNEEQAALSDKLKSRIKAMQGPSIPQKCGLGLCGTYSECRDCGRSPYPKVAPPVSRLDEERSMLKELNKSYPVPTSNSEQSKTATSPKTLDSSHKIPVNLCPASAIIAIALVIAQGHKKPGRTIYNWRDKNQKISYMDYHAAALRHLLKSIDGSDFDQELSELAGVSVRHDWAAMSCLAILEDARQAGTLVDDRPTKGGAEEFLDNLTVKK